MKLLFFADLQAHNYQQFSRRLASGLNSRLCDILAVLEQIRVYATEQKVDAVFFLGDLFESRTKLDIDVLVAVYSEFEKLCKAVPTYLLVGNHDQHTEAGEVHSLEVFRPFARVIDLPCVERVGNLTVCMHPYTTDVESFKALNKTWPKHDLFLFHQGLKEATTGPYDVHTKAELSITDLPLEKARWLIGGHFHKAQMLAKKVWYVGSPLQLSFGERTEMKGFTLLDTEGPKAWELQWQDSNAPVFKVFTGEEFLRWAMTYASMLAVPGKVFVRVECSSEEAKKLQPQYPSVQFDVVEKKPKQEARIDANLAMSDNQLLQAYIKLRKPELDKDRLLSIGMEILAGDAD